MRNRSLPGGGPLTAYPLDRSMAKMRCSFCGKQEEQVRHLVAGPDGVAICNECVDVCVEVQSSSIEFDGNLLLTGIGELTTNDRFVPGLLGTIHDAAVAIRSGVVRWAGPQLALPDRYRALPTLDCGGRAALPGFVDSHTHLLFGGEQGDRFGAWDRTERFRTEGTRTATAATRATADEHLTREVTDRLTRMLEHGTTTVEAKSGYGGDTAGEHRLLDLAHRLDRALPIDIVSTLLIGASVPDDLSVSAYTTWAAEELLAVCAPQASYVDLSGDWLGDPEIDRILGAATDHGLAVRIHGDRPAMVEAALRYKPVSIDQPAALPPDQLARMVESGAVAVFLPSASGPSSLARDVWEAGGIVAVATDCNPTDSYVESMQLVIARAVVDLGLDIAQAVWAATRGGALSLEEPEKGWLGRGTLADLIVLDAPSASHLAYRPGINLAWRVIKEGVVVASP